MIVTVLRVYYKGAERVGLLFFFTRSSNVCSFTHSKEMCSFKSHFTLGWILFCRGELCSVVVACAHVTRTFCEAVSLISVVAANYLNQ